MRPETAGWRVGYNRGSLCLFGSSMDVSLWKACRSIGSCVVGWQIGHGDNNGWVSLVSGGACKMGYPKGTCCLSPSHLFLWGAPSQRREPPSTQLLSLETQSCLCYISLPRWHFSQSLRFIYLFTSTPSLPPAS